MTSKVDVPGTAGNSCYMMKNQKHRLHIKQHRPDLPNIWTGTEAGAPVPMLCFVENGGLIAFMRAKINDAYFKIY
ncbi:hypothetical protein T03_2352 [Trichinella britovi]|uniref:Uncharacterized protein n=1 Tax=Trichinella britovi TaxID=45882 RepID=A0A0V1CME3_TRIBR|nr:hypothetical protein T03_2352 [Trichinella britovi]